jgi:SAM-dependent methyltransferase
MRRCRLVDSKERFTNRVDTYVKYRPTYPKEAIDYLYSTVGLKADSLVADVGAGTGIFSTLLLERGSRVIGVEPNQAMREKAETELAGEYEGFQTCPGSAEDTGLRESSVDFIVCAQSFHWFDRGLAKVEFSRILKPSGKVVLIWNSRVTRGTPFLVRYEQLLHDFGNDFVSVSQRNVSQEDLRSFYEHGGPQLATFKNNQQFDFEGLCGRLLSSSYSPTPGEPKYEPMMKELRSIFEETQVDGVVTMEYETEVFWGSLN